MLPSARGCRTDVTAFGHQLAVGGSVTIAVPHLVVVTAKGAKGDAPTSSLARSFRLTILSYLLVPLTALVTGPLLAHALGPEGRGKLAAVLAPLALANIVATFGFQEAATYFVARAEISSRRIARLAVVCSVAAGALAALVLFLLAPTMLVNAPDMVVPLQLLALSLPVTIGFAGARGVVSGTQAFGRVSMERGAGSVGRLLVLGLMVVTVGLTATNAATVSVIVPIAASLVLIGPALQRTGGDAPLRLPRFLDYSLHASIGTIGGILILQLDQALMTPLSTTEQLGFYAVAVSLASLPAAAVQGVRDVVFSYSSVASDPQLVARSTRVSVAVGLPVVLIGALLCNPVVPFLFGADFEPAVTMARVLLVAVLPNTVSSVMGAGLMSVGRPRVRSAILMGGAALTVLLIIALVPHYGGDGAAIASLLTYTTIALISVIVFTRITGVSVRDCLVVRRSDLVLRRRRP